MIDDRRVNSHFLVFEGFNVRLNKILIIINESRSSTTKLKNTIEENIQENDKKANS